MSNFKKKFIKKCKAGISLLLLVSIFSLSTISVFAQIEADPGGDPIENGYTNDDPVIAVFSPSSGRIGTRILVTGANFMTNNSILFDGKPIPTLATSTAPFNSLEFTVPSFSLDCDRNGNCRPINIVPQRYEIRISNTNGRSRAVNFNVLSGPTTSTTVSAITSVASSTASTTATVTWNTTNSSDSKVLYGSSSGTYTNSTSSATMTTNHSLNIRGLSSERTYYFIVVSKDAANNTATSSEYRFRTVSPHTDGSGLEQGSGNDLGGIVQFVATCAITSFIGNAGKTALSKVIGGASSWVSNKISGAVQGAISAVIPSVPIKNTKIEENTQAAAQNSASVADKETSMGSPTGHTSILSGLTRELFKSPSLDALAFCIGNELIHYIMQSTIQWINSGFKGKPVFIENSDAFFSQIADQEAGLFIQDIMKGANIDVCQPFRVQLAVDSIRSHTSTYNGTNGRGRCTLSAIKNNYQGFMNSWNQGGLPGWFELIQKPNNIYGAKQLAQTEMQKRISQRQNTLKLELGWANGYKSFKYCTAPKRSDGSCPPGKETTGTPGKIIEETINQRLNSAQKRIEIADEFDELVSALVNQLVKTAINEVLSIGSSGGGSQNSVGNSIDRVDPTVSITSPINGATASSTITISADASDNIGVADVQFKIDGHDFQNEDSSAPYSVTWNTAAMPNGTHTISAKATDVAGNTKTSAQISITVSN